MNWRAGIIAVVYAGLIVRQGLVYGPVGVLATAFTMLVVYGALAGVTPGLRARLKVLRRGCCTTCDGYGRDMAAPETGGRCWDCYGTGHCHDARQRCMPWWRKVRT
jgi:hypothetical protein